MNRLKMLQSKISLLLTALVLMVGFVITYNLSSPVLAENEAQTACSGIEAAGGSCGGGESEVDSVIQTAIEILLFIVGVASVIALIVGGLRYITSGGDQTAVAGAKNTIMYAIVGLIVAVLAYAAVQYVFDALGGSSGGGTPLVQ